MPIFDDDDPAAIEDEYISQVIPSEGEELWQRTIDESPVWDSMSPDEHMTAADMFAAAAFAGSLEDAEDFLGYLEVEWDDRDIGDFYDMYEQLAG